MTYSSSAPFYFCLALFFSNSVFAHQHEQADSKKSKTEKMFEQTDTNQDGQLQRSEFLAHAEQRFKRMDLNQDGYVTKTEGKEALRLMREKRKARRSGSDHKRKKKLKKMFKHADVNQDGQVQLSESMAVAEQRFNSMDENKDGYVTKSEGKEAHQEKRKNRRENSKRNKLTKLFDGADANQDGQLELAEFLAHTEQRFKVMDLNGDGAVSKEEGVKAHRAMREKRKVERKKRREQRAVESSDSE